jgi:hypothetical protein
MTIAVVDTPAAAVLHSAPSAVAQNDLNPKQDDYRKNAEVKVARRRNTAVDKGHLLALAQRWLRPADQLDLIRRWMIPVPFEANRLIATDPFFRWSQKHRLGASRSTLHAAPSRRGNGLLSEFRAVIGRCLPAKWEITEPIPARRVVRQFERRDGDSGMVTM